MKKQTIDLNKTKFNNEDELKQFLLSLVLDFATKVNNLENEYYKKGTFEEFKEKYLLLFNKFCTEKRKKKGTKINSIFHPGRYTGIEEAIVKIDVYDKNCVHIFFEQNFESNFRVLFLIKKDNDVWRIDNLKKLEWVNGKL